MSKTLMPGQNDPRATLAGLIGQQPTVYDANFEFRARRRMIEEMLANLRPASAGAHVLYGIGTTR